MRASAVLGSATCPFTHAQVLDEHLMSMRNTCNMLAFAVFGGRWVAHMRAFAVSNVRFFHACWLLI
jgi:hypothetical protein